MSFVFDDRHHQERDNNNARPDRVIKKKINKNKCENRQCHPCGPMTLSRVLRHETRGTPHMTLTFRWLGFDTIKNAHRERLAHDSTVSKERRLSGGNSS